MENNLKIAQDVLEKVGGVDNVSSVTHCMTRLRFDVKDNSRVDEDGLKNVDGVLGFVRAGGQLQVIVGQNVPKVYGEVCKLGGFEKSAAIEENLDGGLKEKLTVKSVFNRILNYLSSSMTGIIPAFMAAAAFKTLAVVLGPDMLKVITAESDLYVLFTFLHDACFYYMPIMVGYTACKKLNVPIILGIYLGAVLLSPTFIGMVDTVEKFTIFGINVPLANYSNSIVPMLIAVWVMSLVYNFFRKYVPTVISTVFVPFLTILVMTPLLFCFIAPLGNYISSLISDTLIAIGTKGGFIGIGIIAAIWEFLVIAGMHTPLVIFAIMSLMASDNPDACILVAGNCATWATYGVALGVFLRAKKQSNKSLAVGYLASGLLGGIAEPTLYGACMKYKKPFIGLIAGGLLGGIYAGITGVVFTLAATNCLSVLGYVPFGTSNMVNGCISSALAFVIAAVVTYILGFEEKED